MKALRIIGMVVFGLWFLNGCGHVLGGFFGLWPDRAGYHVVLGMGINAFTPQPSLRQIGGEFGASRECT